MSSETGLKLKYGFWGLAGGAISAMIVGFNWGGWSTSSTTNKMSEDAVLASNAAICVAQFMQDPSHATKLKEFEALSSYRRSEFIENGGWDRVPGQEKADWGVSTSCVAGIEVLLKAAQATNVPVDQTAQK
jgi:hypothetical protein